MPTVGLCLYYFKKIEKAFSLDKKIRNDSECRMTHHKIKNVFESQKITDFDGRIGRLRNDFFNKYAVFRMRYINN